jgi:uncharacterized protein involved in exopolysaccharide biosynthesis
MHTQVAKPSELTRLLEATRRHLGIVITCALVVPVAALAISLLSEKEYQAQAAVFLRESELDDIVVGYDIFDTPEGDDVLAETGLELATVDPVGDRAAKRLGGGVTGDDLSDRVTVERNGESMLLHVTARASKPEAARRAADEYALAIIGFRRNRELAAVRKAQSVVRRRLDALPPGERRRSRELRTRSEDLETLAGLATGGVELAERADRPSAPSSPKPVRNTVLGLGLGTLLGIGLALIPGRRGRGAREP